MNRRTFLSTGLAAAAGAALSSRRPALPHPARTASPAISSAEFARWRRHISTEHGEIAYGSAGSNADGIPHDPSVSPLGSRSRDSQRPQSVG